MSTSRFVSLAAIGLTCAAATTGAMAQSCTGAGTVNFMAKTFMNVAEGTTLVRVGYASQAATKIVAPETGIKFGSYVEYTGTLDAAGTCQASAMTVRWRAPLHLTLSQTVCAPLTRVCTDVANDSGKRLDISLYDMTITFDGVTVVIPKQPLNVASAPGTYVVTNTANVPRSFNSYPLYTIADGGPVYGTISTYNHDSHCGSFLHPTVNPACVKTTLMGGSLVIY